MRDVFHPDCQVLRTNPHHNRISKSIIDLVYERGSLVEIVSGVKDLVLEYYYHCEMVPDSIFVLHESYVRVKQGSAKLTLKGTQMFRIESNETQKEVQLKCDTYTRLERPISDSIQQMTLCLEHVFFYRLSTVDDLTLTS